MINHGDIENAFGQRLAAMTDCPPVAWENRDMDEARPLLIVTHNPVSRIDPTSAGGMVQQSGFFEVSILTAWGEFKTASNALADQIINRFPKALRLALSNGGQLVILSAQPMVGYRDGVDYRQPVRIGYITG
jgi:hypothetical protein